MLSDKHLPVLHFEHRRRVVLRRVGKVLEEAAEHGEVVAELLRLLADDGRRQLLGVAHQHELREPQLHREKNKLSHRCFCVNIIQVLWTTMAYLMIDDEIQGVSSELKPRLG